MSRSRIKIQAKFNERKKSLTIAVSMFRCVFRYKLHIQCIQTVTAAYWSIFRHAIHQFESINSRFVDPSWFFSVLLFHSQHFLTVSNCRTEMMHKSNHINPTGQNDDNGKYSNILMHTNTTPATVQNGKERVSIALVSTQPAINRERRAKKNRFIFLISAFSRFNVLTSTAKSKVNFLNLNAVHVLYSLSRSYSCHRITL